VSPECAYSDCCFWSELYLAEACWVSRPPATLGIWAPRKREDRGTAMGKGGSEGARTASGTINFIDTKNSGTELSCYFGPRSGTAHSCRLNDDINPLPLASLSSSSSLLPISPASSSSSSPPLLACALLSPPRQAHGIHRMGRRIRPR
jgi:hypothetical protein